MIPRDSAFRIPGMVQIQPAGLPRPARLAAAWEPPRLIERRIPHSAFVCLLAAVALAIFAGVGRAEEIRLHNNQRIYGLIDGLAGPNMLRVIDASGALRDVSIEDIVSITYRGRERRMIQSGTQEFRFIDGGILRAEVLGNQGDDLRLLTRTSGEVSFNLDCFTGFVALPVMGLFGRKALEMVELGIEDIDVEDTSPNLDLVMDRRGSLYPGVVRRVVRRADRMELDVDHETLVGQVVPIPMLYIAGVRLAMAARKPEPVWTTDLRIRIYTRDDSLIEGTLERIYLDRWYIRPRFNPGAPLDIDLQEINLIQAVNGRMQYLSQLKPMAVKESTLLAPPQPFQMDKSCQGDPLVIAGQQYPWGVGVHADSELAFKLGKRFKTFKSAIGIAAQIKEHGSVVFQVLGDGKELYKSPVCRSTDKDPREIEVPIAGVDVLTLKVTSTDDLDLGDVANWGSARLLR